MTEIKLVAIDDVIHMSTTEFWKVQKDIRDNAIEECKEVVRQHWINGTVAYRIAEEIYGSLERLKGQK